MTTRDITIPTFTAPTGSPTQPTQIQFSLVDEDHQPITGFADTGQGVAGTSQVVTGSADQTIALNTTDSMTPSDVLWRIHYNNCANQDVYASLPTDDGSPLTLSEWVRTYGGK